MSEYNRNSSGGRNFEHRGLEGGTLSSYSSTGHRSSSGTSSHTKSTAAHTSTGRRDTAMNRAAAGRSGHTSGRYKKKRRNRLDITQILLIVIGVLAVILIAAIASRGCGGGSAAGGATESDAVQESTVAAGEGAGVTGIILDRGSADIYSPKVIRSTMGSIYRVPFIYTDDLHQTIGEVKKQGIHLYAAHLKGKHNYEEENYTGPSGFLIGNEANGLTEETAALADAWVRIPMAGKVESLNAAVAASVLLFETARQRRQ